MFSRELDDGEKREENDGDDELTGRNVLETAATENMAGCK